MKTNTAIAMGSIALLSSIVLLIMKDKEDQKFYTCPKCKAKSSKVKA